MVSEDDSVSKTFNCGTRPIIVQTGRAYNNYLVEVPWYKLATMLTRKISPSEEGERKQEELVMAR